MFVTALNIFLTEDDYRASETSQSVPVRVAKDSRIATPVTITVNPLTVMQAEEMGEPIMVLMPDDNPFSPNRAGIKSNNTVITLLVLTLTRAIFTPL